MEKPITWSTVLFCRMLAESLSVDVAGGTLLPTGDLSWCEATFRPGPPTDPFTTGRVALPDAIAPAVEPLDRHPVRIAEPVLLAGYSVAEEDGAVRFDCDGVAIPVDTDRRPSGCPPTAEQLLRSSACLGLVRVDGDRWSLQPMGARVETRRKTTDQHVADGAAVRQGGSRAAKTTNAVAVLRERAGRLLRR